MPTSLQPQVRQRVRILVGLSALLSVWALFQAIPLALLPVLSLVSLLCIPLSLVIGVIRKWQRCAVLTPLMFLTGVCGLVGCMFWEMDYESLNKAASHGNTQWMAQLLDNGHSGPDIVDSHGSSLLMRAAQSGNLDTVVELLRRGARTNYRDGDGDTALTVAERYRHQEIARLLRKAGARR